jgi:hypothetical protein
MNEIIDFITSPEFAEAACWFIGGALTGGAVLGIIAGVISRREHRAAMRSRQPRFLSRL